ncbi:MAG: HNH endonuclease, partial [Pseudomonadota bacterium]|nr:HNH endonuclease [Pseudomonadota bacterium]
MAGRHAPPRSLGPCPICGREMIEGPSANRHHWLPKSKGGQAADYIYVVCHRMLNRTLSEKELAD